MEKEIQIKKGKFISYIGFALDTTNSFEDLAKKIQSSPVCINNYTNDHKAVIKKEIMEDFEIREKEVENVARESIDIIVSHGEDNVDAALVKINKIFENRDYGWMDDFFLFDPETQEPLPKGTDSMKEVFESEMHCINSLQELNEKFAAQINENKCVFALVPVRVYTSKVDYFYATIRIELFKNKTGVIRIEVPLYIGSDEYLRNHNIPTDDFEIKTWDCISKESYSDVQSILIEYLKYLFYEQLVHNRFVSFEHLVLSEMTEKVNSLIGMSKEMKRKLYFLINTSEFECDKTTETINDYWRNHAISIGGCIYSFEGTGRCLSIMTEQCGCYREFKEDSIDYSYIANSLDWTIDFFIQLCILRKINNFLAYHKLIMLLLFQHDLCLG